MKPPQSYVGDTYCGSELVADVARAALELLEATEREPRPPLVPYLEEVLRYARVVRARTLGLCLRCLREPRWSTAPRCQTCAACRPYGKVAIDAYAEVQAEMKRKRYRVLRDMGLSSRAASEAIAKSGRYFYRGTADLRPGASSMLLDTVCQSGNINAPGNDNEQRSRKAQ